ncbi:MAG: hypothetical protein KA347_12560, partial [Bacteroidia bacterium]|nr:hypothetical protein [Bacteroidia bacterium]
FTLCTGNRTYDQLKFAIINANQKHKLLATNCELKLLMIEHHKSLVLDVFEQNGIFLSDGFYCNAFNDDVNFIVDEIVQKVLNGELFLDYDNRIGLIISYLNKNDVEYHQMLSTLKTVTNLSESRLSHLFKSNLGISLKRYLIWNKLKFTIKQHLHKQEDLFSCLINNNGSEVI